MKATPMLLVLAAAAALSAGAALRPDDAVDSTGPATMRGAATVTVRVRDAQGVAVRDARVVLSPAVLTGFGDPAAVTAVPRGDGAYEARLRGGDWRVVGHAPGVEGERTFHVDPGGRAEVDLTLR